ncbi:MAG TPA: putative collagen-binding domain-containing protein, partial [Tepidisphaeraceae bacterium]
EICNEPYFEGVSDDWQAHVARTIADTERNLPNKHLVAQNIANNQKKVDKLTPGVSILNFHYARPPETVAMNYAHNVAIGDDETGFDGKEDVHYRTEGWDFVLAGGATYNNLDYSFTPKTPGGTLSEFKSPGGGSARLRRSLGALKKFMDGLDFVHMKPMNAVVKGGRAAVAIGQPSRSGSAARSGQISIRVLGQEGKAYALYLHGGTSAELKLDLPAGKYQAEWIDPRTGEVGKSEAIEHGGGERTFTSPDYTQDIALRIVARAGQP